MPLEQDQPLALESKGILVELIEKEDAVGDLDRELRVFADIMMPQIAEAAVDNRIGYLRFDI